MAMITLKEYAERIGKDRNLVYHKYQRGGFETAVKRGRDIWIDEDEPYIDNRVKSGKYVGWRRDFKHSRGYQQERSKQRKAQELE